MPLTTLVKDIMVPIENYAVIREDDSLKDAVATLRTVYCEIEAGVCTEAGHRACLVLDSAGKLVGVMDFRCILRVLIPEIAGGLSEKLRSLGVSITFAEGDASALDESQAGFEARVVKNAETPVRDVMFKVKGYVDADADIMAALKMMYANRIVILPVFNGDKLVGVVRDSDLFLQVANVLQQ